MGNGRSTRQHVGRIGGSPSRVGGNYAADIGQQPPRLKRLDAKLSSTGVPAWMPASLLGLVHFQAWVVVDGIRKLMGVSSPTYEIAIRGELRQQDRAFSKKLVARRCSGSDGAHRGDECSLRESGDSDRIGSKEHGAVAIGRISIPVGRSTRYNRFRKIAIEAVFELFLAVGIGALATMQKSFKHHEETDDRDLLARCREGDADAQRVLYDRFASRLIQVAQRRIGARLGRRVDGDDVIQSVFRTFFRRARLGEYSPEDSSLLWGRLVRVTLNKTCDAARAQTAGKRDINAEDPGAWDQFLVEAMGREPGPDQAAVLSEVLESLFVSLEKREYVAIIELTLQGFEKQEVAQQVGVSKRTVDRVLARSRAFLEEAMKADDDAGRGGEA